MTLPKTGSPIIETGGSLYTYLTAPLLVYSFIQQLLSSYLTNFLRGIMVTYMIFYTATLTAFTYSFYIGSLCTIGVTGIAYIDEVTSYLCGNEVGYVT